MTDRFKKPQKIIQSMDFKDSTKASIKRSVRARKVIARKAILEADSYILVTFNPKKHLATRAHHFSSSYKIFYEMVKLLNSALGQIIQHYQKGNNN